MPETIVAVLSTFGREEEARAAARALVEEKLAACANILPGVRSIYRWQDRIEESDELLVIFKTTAALVPDLMARLKELHSYDTPEMIALPVDYGFEPYLEWVEESCRPAGAG
jgi:periplasmic divalent cation tolerance protein